MYFLINVVLFIYVLILIIILEVILVYMYFWIEGGGYRLRDKVLV